MAVVLQNVAHAPSASYRLLSFSYLRRNGQQYVGDFNGIVVQLISGRKIEVPARGALSRQAGYGRRRGGGVEMACAVFAPGKAKAPSTPTDKNTSNCACGHSSEILLRNTAEETGVTLVGKLLRCRGCSVSKGLCRAIANKTSS